MWMSVTISTVVQMLRRRTWAKFVEHRYAEQIKQHTDRRKQEQTKPRGHHKKSFAEQMETEELIMTVSTSTCYSKSDSVLCTKPEKSKKTDTVETSRKKERTKSITPYRGGLRKLLIRSNHHVPSLYNADKPSRLCARVYSNRRLAARMRGKEASGILDIRGR